jgi:hypothetical protein
MSQVRTKLQPDSASRINYSFAFCSPIKQAPQRSPSATSGQGRGGGGATTRVSKKGVFFSEEKKQKTFAKLG